MLRRQLPAVLGALAVAALSAALAVPAALQRWFLSEDAIEYLAIANNWVHGIGFVNPVQWNFYLPGGVPLPVLLVRPPVLPVLLAVPMALGASISSVLIVHTLWASVIGGCSVLVASRFMRLPAAIGLGVVLALSPIWLFVSRFPMTEATAIGAFLLVLATAHGVTLSVRGALLCSLSTLLAWLTRPNMAVLALAVAAAAAWSLGPRATLRSRPFWMYVGSLLAALGSIYVWTRSSTGFAPFAGYGASAEALRYTEFMLYGKEFVGAFSYVRDHSLQVLIQYARVAQAFFSALCVSPGLHYIGSAALVSVPYALFGRVRSGLELRVCALAAVGFSLMIVLNYSMFDPRRYPLVAAVPMFFCTFALLDDASRVEGKLRTTVGDRVANAAVWAPLFLALIWVFATSAPATIEIALRSYTDYRSSGTSTVPRGSQIARAKSLCRHIEPDGLVAAVHPWSVLFACGNAGVMLPPDLSDPQLRERFLAEKRPRYFITSGETLFSWLDESEEFRILARSEGLSLYELVDVRRWEDPWKAPPPLICAGQPPGCARDLRR